MRYPITFKNQGELLIGVVHRPDEDRDVRAAARPGVVILHGFTGHKIGSHRMFVKMAERLASMGMVALRFDFRGSGDSEGNFEDMTFGGELSDALLALNYMLGHEGVDPKRLGVLGLSMGGALAACVTGRSGKVRSTALWSAVADLNLFQYVAKDITDEHGPIETYDLQGNLVGRAFIDELGSYVPYEEVADGRTPVLVVHGTADELVPLSHAHQFADALKAAGNPYKLHIIEGADHTYNAHPWEIELIDVTAAWFEQTLLK